MSTSMYHETEGQGGNKTKRQKLFLPSLHMVKMTSLTGKPSYGSNSIVKPNETAARRRRGHNHLFSAVAGRVTTPTDARESRLRLVKQFQERSRERLASIRELARTHEEKRERREREKELVSPIQMES